MNKKLFQSEMRRIFKSDRLYLMWAIVLVFFTFQCYQIVQFREVTDVVPSAMNLMVEFEADGILRFLYIMILPAVVAFIAAQIYVEDRAAGYFPMLEMRIERKEYIVTTAVTSFLAGGIVAIVPLLLQAVFAMTVYPFYRYPYHQMLSFQSVYIGLWLENPIWLWLLSLLQFFLFGAVFALFAYSISLVFQGLHTETFLAFLLFFILWAFRPYVWNYPLEPTFYLQVIYDDVAIYGDLRIVKWATFLLFLFVSYFFIKRKISHGKDL